MTQSLAEGAEKRTSDQEKDCWYCVHYKSFGEGEGYANSILCENWGVWGEGSIWYSYGRMSEKDDEDMTFASKCPYYEDEDDLRATRREKQNDH